MGIPHGHLDVGVPQQVSYRPQVGTCHDQPAGKGVAQIVPCEIFESGFTGRIFKPMSRTAQGFAVVAAGKDRLSSFRTAVQLPEGGNSSIVEVDMPTPAILSKRDQVMAGTEPFFIRLRDCAALLQQQGHSTVDTWIGALRKMGYIKVVKQGNERQATRYSYVSSARGQDD